MELCSARLEASVEFDERMGAFDESQRVTVAALDVVQSLVSLRSGDRILGALVESVEQPGANKHQVKSSDEVVHRARTNYLLLALSAVNGQFEFSLRRLVAEVLEFWPGNGNAVTASLRAPPPASSSLKLRGWLGSVDQEFQHVTGGEPYLARAHELLAVQLASGSRDLLPLFEYFRRCRNRVIHQGGVCGSDLAAFSRSNELQAAFLALTKASKRPPPKPPQFAASDVIGLNSALVTLFSIVTWKLFYNLEEAVRPTLGEDGYVRMAAYYSLGASEHPARDPGHKEPHAPIGRFLSQRYRLGETGSREQLIPHCQRLGIWDAVVDRFHELHPTVAPNRIRRRSESPS